MSLRDWREFGWLKGHRTSREEIAALLAIADRDLKACQTADLGSDWQLPPRLWPPSGTRPSALAITTA
jgi:hypothetical protein